MDERNNDGRAAARDAVMPWQLSLAELEAWFDAQAHVVWPSDGRAQADAALALVRGTLGALARGEDPLSDPARSQPSAQVDPLRIDSLLTGHKRRTTKSPSSRSSTRPAERRRSLLDLALWQALAHLRAGSHAPSLARLHAWLAQAAPPCIGVSPSTKFAASGAARGFFDESARGVLEMLARRVDAAYAVAIPARPFDGSLPSMVAWTHAWSVAVAGAFLEYMVTHVGDDVAKAQRELWAGRLDAVRFRLGAGMTAMPAHASVQFDLWTCAVKAQAITFDAVRWRAHAAGRQRHGVAIDMHDYTAQRGNSVAPLYRCVLVDRIFDVLGRGEADGVAAAMPEQTIAIDVDRPQEGHAQNLRLLLRWRDPLGPKMRRTSDRNEGDLDTRAIDRWLARQEESPLAHALDAVRLKWRAASPDASADPDGLVSIGNGAFWTAVHADVLWIDPALALHFGGTWHKLPAVELVEHADGRTEWLVREDVTLPAGVDLPTLRHAAVSRDAVHWVATEAGLGAFVMVGIDVDASWRAPD